MCQSVLADASFWRNLQTLDEHIAAEVQCAGCPLCGGVLHYASYPRKPAGVSRELLGTSCDRRLSLCCSREGCRRRCTPCSTRFFGRRTYLGAVVLLACALGQGLSRSGRARLAGQLGISERTLERWRRWWRETLPTAPWWRLARAQLTPCIDDASLPSSLLTRFGGATDGQALSGALVFLSPCSLPSFSGGTGHAA